MGIQRQKGTWSQCLTFGVKKKNLLLTWKAAGSLRMAPAMTPGGGRMGALGRRGHTLGAWTCFSRDRGPCLSPPTQQLLLSQALFPTPRSLS